MDGRTGSVLCVQQKRLDSQRFHKQGHKDSAKCCGETGPTVVDVKTHSRKTWISKMKAARAGNFGESHSFLQQLCCVARICSKIYEIVFPSVHATSNRKQGLGQGIRTMLVHKQ